MNERNDWRIFGAGVSIFAMVFYTICALVLLAFAVTAGAWFWGLALSNHSHTEAHKICPTSEIPKEVREDGVTKCVVGSPIYMNTNVSTLQPGNRTDSLLVAQDRTNDNKGTIAKGCGCGKCWTKVDHSGHVVSPHGNETFCNLGGHTIGVETRPHSGRWNWKGVWNSHPQ